MFRALRAAADKVKNISSDDSQSDELYLGAPGYMQVGYAEFASVYGDEITARVFSDEFTDVRWSAIEQTVPASSELEWGMYDLYPYKQDGNDIIWIERYIIKGERDSQRGLLMWLKHDRVHVVHLVPGETLTSPQLQCDTLAIVLPLALKEQQIDGADAFQFDNGLVGNGIPDVWPKGCQATLVDTILIEEPKTNENNWSERWGFQVGGKAVIIDIDFQSATDGGTLILPRVRSE